jgi:Membrane carboxypeptidase (penicillin-binding protein)
MEALLPKRRILELYANVIEMGRGIYGVEAASQHYFGVSARGLTRDSRQCWRRPAESERLGSDESRQGRYDGVSGAFCNVNRTPTSPRSCFINSA